MERHVTEVGVFHPTKIVNEFARSLEDELDYTVEASHLERFARQFLDDETMYVPKVYRHLSTPRVLVMEFIDGLKASDVAHLKRRGYDLKVVASRGADSMLKQIALYGFYHADPHPGTSSSSRRTSSASSTSASWAVSISRSERTLPISSRC